MSNYKLRLVQVKRTERNKMNQVKYYSYLEQFGQPKWKQSRAAYLDEYHDWMVGKGYYNP